MQEIIDGSTGQKSQLIDNKNCTRYVAIHDNLNRKILCEELYYTFIGQFAHVVVSLPCAELHVNELVTGFFEKEMKLPHHLGSQLLKCKMLRCHLNCKNSQPVKNKSFGRIHFTLH